MKKIKQAKLRNKKKLIIWGCVLPASVLVAGGTTVGVLAATGVFNSGVSLINLSTCFSFGSEYADPNTTYNRGNNFDKDEVWTKIKIFLDQSYDENTFINYLNIPNKPTAWNFGNGEWNVWNITLSELGQQKFTGSINYKAHISNAGGGNLITDWGSSQTNIDVTQLGDTLETLKCFSKNQLLGDGGIISKVASAVDRNSIELQYDTTPQDTTSTWSLWNFDNSDYTKFGVDSTNTTSTNNSITLWNGGTYQKYMKIRIHSNGSYYADPSNPSNESVNISIKLFRDDLNSTTTTDWRNIHLKRENTTNGGFYSKPDETQCKESFGLMYSSKSWWNNFTSSQATYSFSNISNINTSTNTGTAQISYSGNPFYNTLLSTDLNAAFTYDMYNKQNPSSGVFVTSESVEITNLGNFYSNPSWDNFRDKLISMNSTLRDSVVWSDFQSNFNVNTASKQVTVNASASSMWYTTDTKTFTYGLYTA